MIELTFLLLLSTMTSSRPELLGASQGKWEVVNDGVMGGLSQGGASFEDGVLIFSGKISLQNNGGFSSIRLPLDQGLDPHQGIRLTLRGDGRRYQMRLRHGSSFDGTAWRAVFVAPDEWTEVELPFREFQPSFRGRRVPEAGPVRPEEIGQIGFLLGDKTAGPFRLEVRSIEPYLTSQSSEEDAP